MPLFCGKMALRPMFSKGIDIITSEAEAEPRNMKQATS